MTWTLTFNGIRAFYISGVGSELFQRPDPNPSFFSPDLQFCTHILHTYITGESCLRRAYMRGLNFQQNAGSYTCTERIHSGVEFRATMYITKKKKKYVQQGCRSVLRFYGSESDLRSLFLRVQILKIVFLIHNFAQ